jgi:hypothetical protein
MAQAGRPGYYVNSSLSTLYWVAYHLSPARVGEKLDPATCNHIESVLRPFGGLSAWHEFITFRQRICKVKAGMIIVFVRIVVGRTR